MTYATSFDNHQALDDFVLDQLSGIDRTFNELTERLGDPDVLANPKLIMEVSQERASVEEVYRSMCTNDVSYVCCTYAAAGQPTRLMVGSDGAQEGLPKSVSTQQLRRFFQVFFCIVENRFKS